MKTKLIFILCLFINFSFATPPSAEDILGGQLENIDEFLSTAGGTGIDNLLDLSIEAQRMDILQKCFENPRSALFLFNNIKERPTSRFIDNVVVMMMRTESYFWPPFYDPSALPPDGSLRLNNYHLQGPFKEVYEKYFPDGIMTADMVRKRENRLMLADKLEAEISRISSNPEIVYENSDNAQKSGFREGNQRTIPENTGPAAPESAGRAEPRAFVWLWSAIVTGLIFTILILIHFRSRRGS